MKNMNARSLLLPAVVALALLAAPAPARAQANLEVTAGQQLTIEKVVDLNKAGVALYQKKKYDGARKLLKQALDLCEAAGLDHHPVAARTHVHLGIVIIGGFGQREIGSKQFTAALQIQPDIQLTPGVASPAIQDVFNEAAVAVSPRSAAQAAASAPPPAETAPAVEAPAVEAPAAEAPVAASAPPPAREQPEEASRVERRAPSRATKEDDDDDNDGEAGGVARSGLQLGALLGAGVGWASGMGDVNADTPVPGSFTAAKLGHLTAEVGYWQSPTLMLSLQGRFQFISGPNVVATKDHTYQPASGATAVFGVATWSPAVSKGRLRPFLSGAIGGGRIRHVVTLSQLKDCGPARNETCVDTVGAGPFLAGAGGGVVYDLGDRVGLVLGVNTQIGAPKFTFNVDFNGGVAFHL